MSQCTICRKDETVHSELQWKTHQRQVQEFVPTYDLTVIKERILSKRRVLENIRKNQPSRPTSSAIGSERAEDWMYVTECSLCDKRGIIRIDFPVCLNCRRDLGDEVCKEIL